MTAPTMVPVFELSLVLLDTEEDSDGDEGEGECKCEGKVECEVVAMEAGTELDVEDELVGLEELINMPEVSSGKPRNRGYETFKEGPYHQLLSI
jgi:hypothetical protein